MKLARRSPSWPLSLYPSIGELARVSRKASCRAEFICVLACAISSRFPRSSLSRFLVLDSPADPVCHHRRWPLFASLAFGSRRCPPSVKHKNIFLRFCQGGVKPVPVGQGVWTPGDPRPPNPAVVRRGTRSSHFAYFAPAFFPTQRQQAARSASTRSSCSVHDDRRLDAAPDAALSGP